MDRNNSLLYVLGFEKGPSLKNRSNFSEFFVDLENFWYINWSQLLGYSFFRRAAAFFGRGGKKRDDMGRSKSLDLPWVHV